MVEIEKSSEFTDIINGETDTPIIPLPKIKKYSCYLTFSLMVILLYLREFASTCILESFVKKNYFFNFLLKILIFI